MKKLFFTVAIATITVLGLSATSAQAQVIIRNDSRTTTVSDSGTSGVTTISPSGVIRQTTDRFNNVDSRTNRSNVAIGPGGVSFDIGASQTSLRDRSTVDRISGPGGSITTGSRSTVLAGQSQNVSGSITPSGLDLTIVGNRFVSGSNSNFQRVVTPGGSSTTINQSNFSNSQTTIQNIRR